MTENILRALTALGIDTWSIHETQSESVEAFYIRRMLDTKRRTQLTDCKVTVFHPFERGGQCCLGSSDASIYPGMGEEEIRNALEAAWHAAALVPNPVYELYAGQHEDFVPSKSGFVNSSLDENLLTMASAMFSADTHEDAFLNSAEFFATKLVHHVLNSNGVDVSWESREVKGEYVVQCLKPQDVETHYTFRYLEPDTDGLRHAVELAIERTRDRAWASELPKTGTYTVIISDEQLEELLSYYTNRSSAGVVYQHYSNWAVGQSVQGERITGDALNISLKATEPYDGEGIPLKDRPLLQDGKLCTLHGGARFSGYLGIEPTGTYRSVEVSNGSMPLADMKKHPYLHVVTFSDFQCDSMTGHFRGEIRLAYLFDGEYTKLVTGGSIHGDLNEVQGTLTFSAERQRTASFEGPLAVCIPNVAVAGQRAD